MPCKVTCISVKSGGCGCDNVIYLINVTWRENCKNFIIFMNVLHDLTSITIAE